MTIELTFCIHLQSDYHVSDGQRLGQTVDSALLRDHQQMPVLRGTALAGLVRDGFLDLKALVEQQKIPRKHELDWDVETRIFGGPSQAKRWVFSSTRPLGNGKGVDGRFGSTNNWRVRINPRTRRSDPQKLFVEEEGDGRISFIFTVTGHHNSDQDRADAALLVAAASMVKHLGSGRRRGRGHCQFQLIHATNLVDRDMDKEEGWQDAALRLFKQFWFDGEILPPLPEAITKTKPAIDPNDGRPKRFRVIAQLQEPLLVAKKSQVANAFETLDKIPGVVLLGALASRAARKMNLNEDSKALTQFADLFLRGSVSVSGLLPAEEKKSSLYAALTAPASWAQCALYPKIMKDVGESTHTVVDLLENPEDKKCADCQQDTQTVSSKLEKVGGFISLADFNRFTLEKKEELHTTMERNGRVKEGDLYTYELINGGQWFVGELSCQADVWETLQTVTGLRKDALYAIRLGKGIRRGYGLTYLLLEEIEVDEPSPWISQSLAARLPKNEDAGEMEISMLLLTDTILWDTWGRSQHNFDKHLLAQLLKIPADNIANNVDQYVSSVIIDGFNTHYGIPRWRDEAIQSGSVVRFALKNMELAEIVRQLTTIEQNGIGLRRHEGFGRVAFNHPLFTHLKNEALHLNGVSLNKMKGLLTEKRNAAVADLESLIPLTVEHKVEMEKQKKMIAEHEAQKKMQALLEESQSHQKEGKQWVSLGDADIPLVRLLYLYQRQPLNALKAWLGEANEANRLEHEQNLWGKRELTGRSRSSKLSDSALALINAVLGRMEADLILPEVGMAMLAERLSQQIEQNRAANKQQTAVAAQKEGIQP